MISRDIVNFSMYCGMYHDGGRTTYTDRAGNVHTVTGSGDVPRVYTLDGHGTTYKELKRLTRGCKLSPFKQGTYE